jgi:hypothetical protein
MVFQKKKGVGSGSPDVPGLPGMEQYYGCQAEKYPKRGKDVETKRRNHCPFHPPHPC